MTVQPPPLLQRDRRLRVLVPALGLLVLLASSGGCRSLLEGSQPQPGAPDGLCSEPIGATGLTLPEAPAARPPRSRVSVELVASRSRIESELAAQIPKELAADSGQPIGAPGRLSYRVTRGALALSVEHDSVVLSTNVLVNVAVCKPLGPFCPVYGTCAPELLARGAVPLLIGQDYSLPKSQVNIVVTRPCVIAGYDATPRLERIASQQAQAIERQINRRLPRLRPQVERAWHTLASPIELDDRTCLRIVPDQVVQSSPRLDSKQLAVRFAVLGELHLLRPCGETETEMQMPPLPAPQVDSELTPGVELRVATVIDWASVSDQLTQKLPQVTTAAGAAAGLPLERVQARGVEVGGQPRIALALDRAGTSCDHLVALAVPEYDGARRRLRLRELTLATPPRTDEAKAEATALLVALQEQADVAVPTDLSGAPSALQSLERELAQNQPAEVAVDLSLDPPAVVQVVPAKEGLVVVVGLDGHLGIAID